MNAKVSSIILLLSCLFTVTGQAQITERERPVEWNNLVFGARFMDRFLPMPVQGPSTKNTWGADNVIPRYTDNGIEDNEWSYWGGNAQLGNDGKYHLFVCRWPENSPKGHMEWRNSVVVHAVADNSFGPYKVKQTVGPGHNPEVFRLQDGRYVIYVIDGYYLADGLHGPWAYDQFEFDDRGRPIIEGLSNLSFARREDGSYLMVCRGGGIWLSRTGLSPYQQVTDRRVYPPVDGRFEDPVVWRTNVQYHMIVNDWYGRIAYYLRSKDGIKWKVEPGEAYLPGIARYEDGTVVDWFKYERIKVLQDAYGRATQAHFAVIDTLKHEDKSDDNHSSKHIIIPLTVGRLITILNKKEVGEKTKTIRVRIQAEEGFDPHADIDLASLRFGASDEVNFGRGCSLKKTKKAGDDLILMFEGADHGFTADDFAGKLLGKTTGGKLLFGYARLPWVDYIEPILSARSPEINPGANGSQIEVEIQNFGQVTSAPTAVKVGYMAKGQLIELVSGQAPGLDSFQKTMLNLSCNQVFTPKEEYQVRVYMDVNKQKQTLFEGKVFVREN